MFPMLQNEIQPPQVLLRALPEVKPSMAHRHPQNRVSYKHNYIVVLTCSQEGTVFLFYFYLFNLKLVAPPVNLGNLWLAEASIKTAPTPTPKTANFKIFFISFHLTIYNS
jgi:hypothetical protein